MMKALIDDAGRFRRTGVGIFGEQGCVHVAPPADLVPFLMHDLFDWLINAPDHLLVRSCVFHYEFEFIHPFSDGNGRCGRLWQSLILGQLHPLFAHLPVENMVYANQQEYYNAITESNSRTDCCPFINFMLQEILNTLEFHQGETIDPHVGINVGTNVGINEQKLLSLIARSPHISAREMAASLGITQRQCERILATLKQQQRIRRSGSNKSGYWEIIG